MDVLLKTTWCSSPKTSVINVILYCGNYMEVTFFLGGGYADFFFFCVLQKRHWKFLDPISCQKYKETSDCGTIACLSFFLSKFLHVYSFWTYSLAKMAKCFCSSSKYKIGGWKNKFNVLWIFVNICLNFFAECLLLPWQKSKLLLNEIHVD